MTKSELIAKIAYKYPTLYLSDIEKIVFTILNTVSHTISSGNRVELRGFGTFGLKELKARKSRNPRQVQQFMLNQNLFHISEWEKN